MTIGPQVVLGDLPPEQHDEAVPIIKDCFTGYYRWHAKRTLREIELVRSARVEGRLVGFAMLSHLVPEAGYVYYIAVETPSRRKGIAAALLDDALGRFRSERVQVVYAAAESDNAPSLGLFRSRGFREVSRDEPHFREGGLGAWGLRSKMHLVSGEVLLGLRLVPSSGSA